MNSERKVPIEVDPVHTESNQVDMRSQRNKFHKEERLDICEETKDDDFQRAANTTLDATKIAVGRRNGNSTAVTNECKCCQNCLISCLEGLANRCQCPSIAVSVLVVVVALVLITFGAIFARSAVTG